MEVEKPVYFSTSSGEEPMEIEEFSGPQSLTVISEESSHWVESADVRSKNLCAAANISMSKPPCIEEKEENAPENDDLTQFPLDVFEFRRERQANLSVGVE